MDQDDFLGLNHCWLGGGGYVHGVAESLQEGANDYVVLSHWIINLKGCLEQVPQRCDSLNLHDWKADLVGCLVI